MPPKNNDTTFFAETDFRGKKTKFGIKDIDRARHFYVIGKSGVGKSTLLENMAIQDIQNGHGIAFIDPHGDSADILLNYVPEHRIKDVVYFAPFDLDYPISFNVMEDVGRDGRHLVVSGLMSAFRKIWGEESWSDRMAYMLNNILLALLEYPGSTLLGVNRMIADKDYRNKVVENVTDPSVKSYWLDEFANYTERFAAEATPALQNKIGQFTSNPLIRNIIGQGKSSFSLREIMDSKKILIVNLSKGQLGEDNAKLIGAMLITKIYLAAMSRAGVSAENRNLPPFYVFVDEFQSFANESFANILSEARKYKLALTLANQYVEQMSEEVRAAVFGNVGTTVSFRVGPLDAELLEKLFSPTFTQEDLVNLDFAQIYLSLMIDGMGSTPFSARTFNRPPMPVESFKKEIIAASRTAFAKPRLDVEKVIGAWHEESRNKRGGVPAGKSSRPSQPFQNNKSSAVTIPPTPPKTPEQKPAPKIEAKVETTTISNRTNKVLSLKSLTPDLQPAKSTGKHSADLKQILEQVQKESNATLKKAPEKPKEPPSVQTSKTEKTEVPEDVLKKMLEL
jgi:hypothetical protein